MSTRRRTADDDQALLTLRASGVKWHLIAKTLNRTEAATITRAVHLRKSKAAAGIACKQQP